METSDEPARQDRSNAVVYGPPRDAKRDRRGTRKILWVAAGLFVCTAVVLYWGKGEARSLSEYSDSWDSFPRITKNELTKAVTAQLSSRFRRQQNELDASLSIGNMDPLQSKIDSRKENAKLRIMQRYGSADNTFSKALAGGVFSNRADPLTALLEIHASAGAFTPGSGANHKITPFADSLGYWAERRSELGESSNIPRNSAIPPGTPDLRKNLIPVYPLEPQSVSAGTMVSDSLMAQTNPRLGAVAGLTGLAMGSGFEDESQKALVIPCHMRGGCDKTPLYWPFGKPGTNWQPGSESESDTGLESETDESKSEEIQQLLSLLKSKAAITSAPKSPKHSDARLEKMHRESAILARLNRKTDGELRALGAAVRKEEAAQARVMRSYKKEQKVEKRVQALERAVAGQQTRKSRR